MRDLSDEEPAGPSPSLSRSCREVRGSGQVKRPAGQQNEMSARQRLTRLSCSICKCARRCLDRSRPSCFAQFRNPEALKAVLQLRREIHRLHKLDSDKRDTRRHEQFTSLAI